MYTEMVNVQYIGASSSTDQMSREDCQAVCDGDTNCVAYGWFTREFLPGHARCWIHTEVSLELKLLLTLRTKFVCPSLSSNSCVLSLPAL